MTSSIYNKFRRITSNQLYLPEIDGIRFLAISLVVLFHIHGYFVAKTSAAFSDAPDNYRLLNTFLEHGNRGVELFFVLSGFILCLPFAHQYINNGKKVLLSKYYLRRLTRLEPPYFIAMTAILLMQLAIHVKPPSVLFPSWLASLIYSHNIIYHHKSFLTTVAWSLEIEIQFYLVAPILFRALLVQKHLRRYMILATYAALLLLQYYYPPKVVTIYAFAEYFLAGILLADLYVSNTFADLFRNRLIIPISIICLTAIIYWPFRSLAAMPYMPMLSRILFPFTIALFFYTVLKNEVIKKVFSYKFIPVIGGMCYSLYLLHYTIISVLGRFTMGFHLTEYYIPNLLLQFFLIGVPVLAISSVYYYFIERPFMSSKWLDMLIKKNKTTTETNPLPIPLSTEGNEPESITDIVRLFVAETSGCNINDINVMTRIEEDLGITGTDAIELLIAFGKEFKVDVSNFMAADYFHGEGHSWLNPGYKPNKKTLLIAHLIKAVSAGKLDESVTKSKISE